MNKMQMNVDGILKVTQEDIFIGKPHSSESCPIACAARRLAKELFPGCEPYPDIEGANSSTIGIFCGSEYNVYRIKYTTNAEIQNFIDAFDGRLNIPNEPFEMNVTLEAEKFDDYGIKR